MRFKLLIGLLLCLACTRFAAAQNVCQVEAGRADQAIREQYQHSIDYFLKLAAAARIKGIDPRRFPQVSPTGQLEVIDLVQIAQDLSARRDQAIQAIYVGFQECQQGVAPYQAIVNRAIFFLTGGMSQVVPGKALHIDASNLLAGTPFGGPNALVPQAREQIFSMLGIQGPVADVIRNPLAIGPGGPFRAPWSPILMPGLPPVALPSIPPIRVSPPPLPRVPPPPRIEIGKVGGHRVCLPWC